MGAQIDLNADIGERFGHWHLGDDVDAELMALITSANLAAGFHAGDPSIIDASLVLAQRHGVAVGVHPGFGDLVGFGRRHIDASAAELVNDVLYQLGAVAALAARRGLALHHLKLHGALFMHAARDQPFAELLVEALLQAAPGLPLYCLPDSALTRAARTGGVEVVREFYADRDYSCDGSIVFVRRVPRLDPEAVADKVLTACTEGVVTSVDGKRVEVEFESICLHSDTPGALEIARAIHRRLTAAGFRLAAG